ncbi:MAG: NAD-dependent epimerase/dehydratase family protein [Acidimicrobiales bacterium]
MRGAKILVTGPTGQVATPITLALAADNEVWGAARFTDPASREVLEDAGVHCAPVDLIKGDFATLPTDFDYVVNLAVVRSGRWSKDLTANGESTGLLMAHCRAAKAFLHCSSAAVYAGGTLPNGEEADLGDNHRHLMPTYSISKIAAEVVVRTMARLLDLPTTIARLSVPYGDNGGWPSYHLEAILAGQPIPVPPGGPDVSRFNPIHEDDIVAQVPRLLEAASVPATTVNWGGSAVAGIHEWCEYMATLVGRSVTFVETDDFTIQGTQGDMARMHELIGPTTVDWRDGIRRMVATRHPEIALRA